MLGVIVTSSDLRAEFMASNNVTALHEHTANSFTSSTDEDVESGSGTAGAQLRDSACDFNTVLAAANLKIKLARAADAAALDFGRDAGNEKPVVITCLAATRLRRSCQTRCPLS